MSGHVSKRNTLINPARFSRRPKVQETQENDEMSELNNKCEEFKTYCTELNHRILKLSRSSYSYIEDGKKVAETLHAFHSKLSSSDADTTLVECIGKTRDFQINLDDLLSKLSTNLENKLAVRFGDFVRDDLTNLKNTRKNFQKVKLAYDSAVQAAKNAKSNKKLAEKLEQDAEVAKAAYMKVGGEALYAVTDTNKEFELLLLRAFCDYWDSYLDFFTKGYKWVTNVRPIIDGYREHLKKQTDSFEETKVKRKSANSNAFKSSLDTKIFGCTLTELCERDHSDVPKTVERFLAWIEKNALRLEGIFRISALKDSLTQYKNDLNNGKKVDFDEIEDPHLIPGLLKMFLREMPEPLLTFDLYSQFIKANTIDNEEVRIEEMKRLVKALPKENRAVFKRMLGVLQKIADNQDVTKMGATNLSTVIGPNILYDRQLNPQSMVEDMENANGIIVSYIIEYDRIFAFDSALEAAKERDLTAVKRLISQNPKSINDADESGKSCLHYAVDNVHLEMVKYLVTIEGVNLNLQDQLGNSPIIYSCKENDTAQIIGILLVANGADCSIKNKDDKTILDLAGTLSKEFLQALLSEKESLASGESQQWSARPNMMRRQSLLLHDERKQSSESSASDNNNNNNDDANEENKDVKSTADEVKAADDKLDQSAEIEDHSHDDEVDEIIFERTRSLQSLVADDIPLQSVYSVINVNEMTIAAFSLTQTSSFDHCDQQKISNLNNSLKLNAAALKNLFAMVKKFASLFGEDEKKEILSNALILQGTTKTLINAVKDINNNPDDVNAKNTLISTAKQIVDTIYKFFKACESASLEYVTTTTQVCSESITRLLQAANSQNKDELDAACKAAAHSCLKLSQIVKAKATQSSDKGNIVALHASSSIIEKSTLDIINESRKTFAQGGSAKISDELTNLAKKLLLEYRQITTLSSKDVTDENIPIDQQSQIFSDFHLSLLSIIEKFNSIKLSNDLDKALFVQLQLIARTIKQLSAIESLKATEVMENMNSIVDCINKLKVGINSMVPKTRDREWQLKLKILAEAFNTYTIILRLSAAAFALQLPIAGELQIPSKVGAITRLCESFFSDLYELRASSE